MLTENVPSPASVRAVTRETNRFHQKPAAFRQAGRAVAHWAIGERLRSASIAPCNDAGNTAEEQSWSGQTHGECANPLGKALIALAGPAAELSWRHMERGVSSNEMPWIEIEADLIRVALSPSSDVMTISEDDLVDRASEAIGVTRDHWLAITAVADLLMRNGTVDEQDVRACCDRLRRIPR